MNESTATRAINNHLKGIAPTAVVWKVSDRFNAGRPDCHYLLVAPAYVEYKFERVEKLPGRHTPSLSPLQKQELERLHALHPNSTRVIVCFAIGKKLTFVEYASPEQWLNSTPLNELQHFTSYAEVAKHLLSLISH